MLLSRPNARICYPNRAGVTKLAARLTDKKLRSFKAADKRQEIADGGCSGLYFVVQASPSAATSWALRYRSPLERDRNGRPKPTKLTLGPYPRLSLADA